MEPFLAQLEQSGLRYLDPRIGALSSYPLVLFLHTLGLSTVVGLSSAIDLRLLGIAPGIPLESLQKTFGLLWAGLALTALTGTLLFMSDAVEARVQSRLLREARFRGPGGRRAGHPAGGASSVAGSAAGTARQAACGRVARLLVYRAQRGSPHGVRQRVRLVNLAHLHLLLNHAPTIGFAVGLGLFGLSFVRQSEDLRRASFLIFFGLALIGIPVYLSGDAAHFILRNTGDVSEGLVVAHRNAALLALVAMEITGLVAWLALWRGRRWQLPAVMLLSLVSFVLLARAATIGGQSLTP